MCGLLKNAECLCNILLLFLVGGFLAGWLIVGFFVVLLGAFGFALWLFFVLVVFVFVWFWQSNKG